MIWFIHQSERLLTFINQLSKINLILLIKIIKYYLIKYIIDYDKIFWFNCVCVGAFDKKNSGSIPVANDLHYNHSEQYELTNI